jgi:DNA primase
MISETQINQVREATDIVAVIGRSVQLKGHGKNYTGLCPFHHEKTPSFSVNAEAQYFHCFGCGVGGDVFAYLMKHDNMEFVEAVRYLADQAHITLEESGGRGQDKGKTARLKALCQAAAEFYNYQLLRVKSAGGDAARAYLHGRALGGAVAKRWQLGYAPGRQALIQAMTKQGYKLDELIEANLAVRKQGSAQTSDRFFNRVIFPIHDTDGATIAFGGRVVGVGQPKYLNSSDTPLFSKRRNLYALDRAKAAMTAAGAGVVVEGYTDVIAMHEAGFNNVVATLGTSLTIEHVKLLARYSQRIIYLFDGDSAGQHAAQRAAGLITEDILPEKQRRPFELYAAVLPDGLDPAELIGQRGAEAMSAVLDGAVPLLRFAIDAALAAFDLADFTQRSRALGAALQVILPIRGSMLADDYLSLIADRLGTEREVVKTTFGGMRVSLASLTESRAGSGQRSAGGSPAAAPAARRRALATDPTRDQKLHTLVALDRALARRLREPARVLLLQLALEQFNDRIASLDKQQDYAKIADLQRAKMQIQRALAKLPKVKGDDS